VFVLIETLPPEAIQGGLTTDILRTDVELRLRRSGVNVLTRAQFLSGGPELYLSVNLLCDRVGLCAFGPKLDLIQQVTLARDPSIIIPATTWSIASVGTVGQNKIPGIRRDLADLVDHFLNDYLAVNPR
jgi:hypothetical protein